MYDDPLCPPDDGISMENPNPPDNGWWELINGAWRWMTTPTPVVISQPAEPA